jgi:hypothetical protein
VEAYLSGQATMPTIARELGTTPATISRWVKDARARGVTAAPPSPAERVAALAPPPAPPPEPEIDLGDGSAASMIPALLLEYRAHLETAKRMRTQGDPKAETAARTAAVKTAQEIRQLRAALADEGGEALALTRDDVEAARLEVRRRLDEIAAAQGVELMWSLDGTPKVRTAPVTPDASHVTGVTPPRAGTGT